MSTGQSRSIDLSVLEDLRSLETDEEPDFVLRLIEVFLEVSPGRVDAIQSAHESGDRELMRKQAHSLKSTSGTVGAKTMAELCGKIEELEACGPLSAQLCKELAEEFRQVQTELRQWKPPIS